ncbi:PAS domain S-box protein [Thalassobellus suaedae]|uniref:PAS domain S-box protein n=1 Tax=Thalassobellus suaedae TaxID=3074124 RepID=A0ABY9XPG1_9FLAO|nr:PAS domain S-box protein [Flavobacteriaceae bacterium HL-DH14]
MMDNLQNEGLFQNIFQSTTEGILVVNNNGTILMANPACKNLFDCDSDALLGRNIKTLIAKKYRKQLKDQLINIEKTAFNISMDVVGVKNNGTDFSLEIRLNSTVVNGKKGSIAFLKDTSNLTENLLKIQQTNKFLIESNRKFDALINNLRGIVFRCKNDRDLTMEYISEGCEQITGYHAEAFLNGTVHFSHIIFQEDHKQVWNDTQKAIKNKKPFTINFRIRDKNGKVKYLQELGQGVFDKNGNLEAIEGFMSDVTLHKETEFIIKAGEAKIKALLEAIPDMMIIQDYNGNYLDFYAPQNKKLAPVEDIIGKNMADVLPPSTYKKIKKTQEKTIATKQMQLIEYKIKTKRKINYYEARIVPLNNHSILSIVRNITEAKGQEASLKIRNNALASADNGIIISDAKQPNKPIIYCNTAFEKITGYKKEEVYGKNCNFLQSDDRNQNEIGIMKNAIANGESCKVILRNYKKDGTLFWNEVAITPIHNQNKELTHFIGVQNDVSDRIKGEHLKNKIRDILELITHGKSLQIIANSIVETVEAYIEDSMVSILLLNKETKTLHKLAAPHLPETFSNFIDGVAINPKVVSYETNTAFLNKKGIVSNIACHDLWEGYKTIALNNGIKSCWSFPILSALNQVLGVFVIYSKNKKSPSEKEREIVLDMTYLCSVV